MEKALRKKVKIAKLKLEKNGKILADESEVGYIQFDIDKKKNKRFIADCFEKKDDKLYNLLRKIRMPQKFTFIWIDKIYVKQSKRGKGFGSKILKLMEKRHPANNVVLGLSPGSLVKTSDIKKLIPFYKKHGYTIISSRDHYYGFKVLKR